MQASPLPSPMPSTPAAGRPAAGSHIHLLCVPDDVLPDFSAPDSETARQKLRSWLELHANRAYSLYLRPAPLPPRLLALLHDELLRCAAPQPWDIVATPVAHADLEIWKQQQRSAFSERWPLPQTAAPDKLVQIGAVTPMPAAAKGTEVAHERLFAGQHFRQTCIAQLDLARAEMRRLLWQESHDIGQRRKTVLAKHAALYDAMVVGVAWAGDQPVDAGHLVDDRGRRNTKLLFGQPLAASKTKQPWSELRQEVFEGLTRDVHEALADGRFTSAADSRALPRVLILGESGTGKSLVVEYLARRVSEPGLRRLQRVSIPDYVGAESNLRYELFGYAPGSFTDASARGEPGLLLSNVGGVVFLDEIGDASPALQARLLAYLDDYRVRPLGYHGSPFACPALIVAATNRPIDEWAEAHRRGLSSATEGNWFRHDLLERFDVVVRLPALNERVRAGDLPAIVDSLLQTEAVNPIVSATPPTPRRRISSFEPALTTALAQIDYTGGNLRKLSRLLTVAVQRAAKSGRDYLLVGDLPNL